MLARRFQQSDVNEPSVADSVKILKGLKPYFEDHHRIKYTAEAIKSQCEAVLDASGVDYEIDWQLTEGVEDENLTAEHKKKPVTKPSDLDLYERRLCYTFAEGTPLSPHLPVRSGEPAPGARSKLGAPARSSRLPASVLRPSAALNAVAGRGGVPRRLVAGQVQENFGHGPVCYASGYLSEAGWPAGRRSSDSGS